MRKKMAPPTDDLQHAGGADLSVLDRSVGGDPQHRARLLRIFAVVLGDVQPALERAIEARECAPLARLGHALKNSARTVGAEALAEAAELLEAAARAGSWERIDEIVPTLRSEAGRVREQIDRQLQ
jgi:HPt (histidine-containing phosphotransfer) domain-containing protein